MTEYEEPQVSRNEEMHQPTIPHHVGKFFEAFYSSIRNGYFPERETNLLYSLSLSVCVRIDAIYIPWYFLSMGRSR